MSYDYPKHFRQVATCAIALASATFWAMLSNGAHAQTVEELPPVVVEGATLAKPSGKPKTQAPSAGGSPAAPAPAPVPAESPSQAAEAESPGAPADSGTGDGGSVDGVAIDRLGSAVTVVTGEQLRRQQIRYAADALRSLPGVSVNRTGGFGGLTQVRIRGAEGNHTLVLIDGIEANDTTNGEFDFSDLSAEDIEQIEVIRGGYSGVYGSGAVGGVINIVTRGGRGPMRISAFAEGGAFKTKAGGARVSGGNDQVWGSVSFSKRETDGFDIAPFGSEDDGAELATLNMKGGAQILPGVTLDLTLRNINKSGDRDAQDPFPSLSGIQVDDPATFDTTIWLGGVKLTWEALDGRFTQTVKATRNETDRTDNDPAGGFFTGNLGERINYAYQATALFETPALVEAKHALTGFVDSEEEFFTSTTSSTIPFFTFPADGVERKRERIGYAGEYLGEFADRLFLTGAIRYDDNSVFENFATWRASATDRLPEIGLRPHASVGTAVKFPTMFEQFGVIPGFFLPNPDLKPEESFGWDAGVELTMLNGRAVIDVTYFEADLENEIRGVGFPATPINLDGESKRDGIEISSRFALTPQLSLGASYTYLESTDPDGAEEIRRAPHTGRIDANYIFAGGLGNFNVAAVYNGDTKDSNFGPFPSTIVTLDEYWLVTAAASYEVKPGVQLFGRVENLLDEDYQEVFGFETAGAAAYAGVRLTHEEPASEH